MKLQSALVRTVLASALAMPCAAQAGLIDINGGSSWGGWDSVGNSQTSGMWVKGSLNRTYNIFRTTFALASAQTVTGTRLANGSFGDGVGYMGDTAADLFTGGWQAGDRIIGLGIEYTGSTRGSTFYLQVDANGDNIAAASSFGANDGIFSHDAGDISAYVTGAVVPQNRWRCNQYSVFTGYSPDGSPANGNYVYPYGTVPNLAAPVRSYAVLDNGSNTAAISVQVFLNIDAVARGNGGLGYGEGAFAWPTRIGFNEAIGGASTNQIFALPAPGAIALLGLGGLVGRRRRR